MVAAPKVGCDKREMGSCQFFFLFFFISDTPSLVYFMTAFNLSTQLNVLFWGDSCSYLEFIKLPT